MTADISLSATLELACELIGRASVSPADGGCQEVIAERLQKHGFAIEHMPFGKVKNLWARRGTEGPLFVFAGHTDVVPTGPQDKWKHPPFKPTITDGILYGRGSADMKTGVAAFTTALERFVHAHPKHKGSVAVLLTSDEEADAIDGTVKVVQALQTRKEHIDFCIVGEATSENAVADTIKNGRRGSLTGRLHVRGKQGHVAYPDRADNPIHRFAQALADLCAEKWDDGNEFFAPTSMQFSNLNAGTGADNVIPAELTGIFNFRFSSESTADDLQKRTEAILSKHGVDFEIKWRVSGHPFLTQPGSLIEAVSRAVQKHAGHAPKLSTTGGTSDARFIAPTGAQVIELGLINKTIHQVDEHASVADIDTLSGIYEDVLTNLLG